MRSVIICLLSLTLLSGCITRAQVMAEAWLQSGIEDSYCQQHPEVQRYGIYRKLNDGTTEFLSYCAQSQEAQKPLVQGYTSFNTTKLGQLLDALIPKSK